MDAIRQHMFRRMVPNPNACDPPIKLDAGRSWAVLTAINPSDIRKSYVT
jgi:hypothetical protein